MNENDDLPVHFSACHLEYTPTKIEKAPAGGSVRPGMVTGPHTSMPDRLVICGSVVTK